MIEIAIGIPTCGPPTWGLLDSMMQFQAYHYKKHPDVGVTIIRPGRSLPVHVARNYIAAQFLETDATHLWFIDQDCAFLPGTLDRLLHWQVPIVGALCLVRGAEECWPMIFKGQLDDGDNYRIMATEVYQFVEPRYDVTTNRPQILEPADSWMLNEVDFTGCHCLLLERRVLEQMKPPWFWGIPGKEDKTFCLSAAAEGFKVLVDFSVFAGHMTGTRTLGLFDFMAHYRYVASLQEAGIKNDKKD